MPIENNNVDISIIPKTGTIEVDFGNIPISELSYNVTGLSDIKSTSKVNLFIQSDSTEDNNNIEHNFASIALRLIASNVVEGVGFTINIYCIIGLATGKFKINYTYN